MEDQRGDRLLRMLPRPRVEKQIFRVAQVNMKLEEWIIRERSKANRVQLPAIKSPYMVFDPTSQSQPIYYTKRAKNEISRASWIKMADTPGPGTYPTERGFKQTLPRAPMFSIIGERKPKRHDVGPFTTL